MKRIIFGIVLALAVGSAHAQVSNGRVTTAAPTYLNNSTSPFSLDTAGNLRITSSALGVTQVTSPWVVDGNVASGAADSGNPVKTGTVFNTTPPALTTGQRADMQSDVSGNLRVSVTSDITTGTDAVANTNLQGFHASNAQTVALRPWPSAGYGFNGTSWDRIKTDPTVIGAQWNIIRDAAGNARGANVTAGNALQTDDTASSPPNAAIPANAMMAGAQSGANIVNLIQANNSAAITMSTATTTQFVALVAAQKIYVTSFDVIAGGTTNVTFVTGTGANCATGQTALTGPYPLTAQAGIAKGGGLGPVLVIPAGQALCVTSSAAVQVSGSLAYTQF